MAQISDSELELMKILWEKGGSAYFAEVMEVLTRQNSDWKPNTVLTFLVRLTDKGMVRAEKINRKNRYSAAISETEYTSIQTRTFLDKVYHGDAKSLASALVQQDYLTGDDLTELKKFWEELSSQ